MTPKKVGGYVLNISRNVSDAYRLWNKMKTADIFHVDVLISIFSTCSLKMFPTINS